MNRIYALRPISWYRWLVMVFINGEITQQRKKLTLKSVVNTFFGGTDSYVVQLFFMRCLVVEILR